MPGIAEIALLILGGMATAFLARLTAIAYPPPPILMCGGPAWGEAREALRGFAVPEGDAADLRARLDRFLNTTAAGLPVLQDVQDLSYGLPRSRLVELVRYWRDSYAWEQRRAAMNALPQFRVAINGLGLHFFHLKGLGDRGKRTVILVHGWPGSFTELLETGRLLNSKGYEVVIPSLPSYGFSDIPIRSGFTFVDAACMLRTLVVDVLKKDPGLVMCQGGDYGAFVCGSLGQMLPALKLHFNFFPVLLPPISVGSLLAWPLMQFMPWFFSQDTLSRFAPSPLQFFIRMMGDRVGYFHIHVSAPDTLGAGLMDSPAFLLAWIAEKFFLWSDNDRAISVDHILDDVMVYWVSKTATSSVRWYRDMVYSPRALASLLGALPNNIWAIDAPYELFRPPRSWLAHRMPNLRRFRTIDRGGHFLALQLPDVVAEDVHSAWEEEAVI